MIISLFTAGITGFLLLVLSLRVSLVRRSMGISVGDGDDHRLFLRQRAQANLVEYAPLSVILLYFSEQNWGSTWFILCLAVVFVAARLLHAIGMETAKPNVCRFIGASATFAVLALLAFLAIARGISLLAPCASCTGQIS